MRAITSASNLFRRALCPGSARLEAPLPDEDTPDAREGTLLHEYSANLEYDRGVLKPDQRDLLELGDELVQTVIQRVGKKSEGKRLVEQHLATPDGRLTGTPDLLIYYAAEGAALVIDRKFGFKIVERAELNIQLRAYAVLANAQPSVPLHSIEETYVAIVQPRAPYDQRITIARYLPADIEQSQKEIATYINLSERERAKLNPGEEQCRYCKARLICPALTSAIAQSLTPFVPKEQLTKTAREVLIENRLSEATDEQLAGVLQGIAFAGYISDAAKAEARIRIPEGRLPDYYLGKESQMRSIADTRKAISLLTLAGVLKREQLLEIAELPIRQIVTEYRKLTGAKWKDAEDRINKVLQTVIDTTTKKASVLRK